MCLSKNMMKIIAGLILLVSIGCVSADKSSKHIQVVQTSIKQDFNGIDWCPQCINSYDDLIQGVLDVILQYGILNTCGDLCNLVADKTGSDLLGFLCDFGCDVLGLEEFVKLINKADIDPIYYCEEMKLCPGMKEILYEFFIYL